MERTVTSRAAGFVALASAALQGGNREMAVEYAQRAVRADRTRDEHFHLLGRTLRAAGRSVEAVDAYRKAIRLRPSAASHYVGLGIALRGANRADEALAAYRRAASLQPEMAEAHHNIGNLLIARGDTVEAEASYRRALHLNPRLAEAHFELGNIAAALGDDALASASFEAAVTLRPDYAAAWRALGELRQRGGDEGAALEAHAAAAMAEPGRAETHLRIAFLLQKQGDRDGAVDAFRRGLAFAPDDAEALANLGNLLRSAGQHFEARACLERAVTLRPDFPEAWFALGVVLHDLVEWAAAAECYAKAIELRPDMAIAHVNLGILHQRSGRIEAGLASTLRAFELDPGQYKACNNMGSLHLGRADIEAAMRWQRRALEIKPDYYEAQGNLCMTSNYADGLGPADILAIHRAYGRSAAIAVLPAPTHGNAPDPGRRLRIGFVSPDLRRHSVAYFLEPLLEHHDRDAFEFVAYYNYAGGDDVTERLRGHFDAFLPCVGFDDEALARRIEADGIDILMDLAGHTDGGRLAVFARRPAPVQAGWMGYVATTGLDAIGYRITDANVDPAGHEAFAVEKPLRLSTGYLCYRPDPAAPAVGPLPAGAEGAITFGSFNNLAKISPATVALWAKVLHAVPDSRLRLKTRNLADPTLRRIMAERFAAHGIGHERLDLLDWEPGVEGHLGSYSRIDIGLDTGPFNGVTTTCEALWMGVPVVSRVGATQIARQGLSLLGSVGLGHLAQPDEAGFVQACVSLAADRASLARLRAGMRERLRASSLLDGAGFARAMEAAWREMWCDWCEGQGATSKESSPIAQRG
jgi:predicted O-linked N-acetylglucosamine transferase (SPINDLY family)